MKQEVDNPEADRELLQFADALRRARPALSGDAMERVAATMRAELEKQPSRVVLPATVSYVKFRIAAAALIAVTVAMFWMLQREPLQITVATQTIKRTEIHDTYTVTVPGFPSVTPNAPLLRTDENASLFQ